jgi:hypothetical protein
MDFDIGTWYFDKWARCYVQVVAGAQHDAYVTVAGYQPPIICSVRREDLVHSRSHRVDSMVGPVPVELQDKYEVTEREYSWGTVVSLYRNNKRVMFVDVFNSGHYAVYENV